MKRSATSVGLLFIAGIVAWFGLSNVGSRTQEVPVKPPRPDNVHLIPSLEGADLFRAYCAPCHGSDGTGNGPVAPALNSKLPDLTTLAQRNGRVFPTQRVKNLISGDDVVIAHGSREMPIWGPIFHQIEADRDYGYVRLNNVTKYIESIQQK